MKKTLALILSILVAFSMFTVAAFAEGETEDTNTELNNLVKVVFIDSDKETVISTVYVSYGDALIPYAPENPVKEADENTKYTFEGWISNIPVNGAADNSVYYRNTLPTVPSKDNLDVATLTYENEAYNGCIVYTAEYMETPITNNQTFWKFVQSIFARINLIFEYFATIFDFSNNK